MKEIRKIFHPREIIIAFVIAFAMLLTGTFLDSNITLKVYDPVNTSFFGIIFAGIGELPVVIGITFAGTGLIICRKKKPIWLQILMIVIGVVAIGLGVYFCFDTCRDWAKFKNTESHKTLIIILGLLFTLLVEAGTILVTIFTTRKANKDMFLKISIVIIASALTAVILGNVLKYFWGRTRPRAAIVLGEGDLLKNFDPIWSIHPLRSIIYKLKGWTDSSNNYKSCPSGHTIYSATGLLVFPLLTLLNDKTKNNRVLQIILFYIAVAWTVIVAISRVYAGAHYLSDTAMGFFTTLVSINIGGLIVTKIVKDRTLYPTAE